MAGGGNEEGVPVSAFVALIPEGKDSDGVAIGRKNNVEVVVMRYCGPLAKFVSELWAAHTPATAMTMTRAKQAENRMGPPGQHTI